MSYVPSAPLPGEKKTPDFDRIRREDVSKDGIKEQPCPSLKSFLSSVTAQSQTDLPE